MSQPFLKRFILGGGGKSPALENPGQNGLVTTVGRQIEDTSTPTPRRRGMDEGNNGHHLELFPGFFEVLFYF